jgi:site-specific DNA recombinase
MTEIDLTVAREYLRVSADASGRLISTAEQHGDHESLAAEKGWTLGAQYAEKGAASASRYGRKDRDGFADLVADLEAGTFGAGILIMWEASRGSRKTWEWARLIEALKDAGVKVYVWDEERQYDPSNAHDRKSLRDGASAAEYESDKISLRVGRAMRSEAAKGNPHGRTVYGYTRTYRMDNGTDLSPGEYLLDPKAKIRRVARQVPHPEQSRAVRLIFASILAGESLRSIAAALNGDGVRTAMGGTLAAEAAGLEGDGIAAGAAWTPARVRDVALNVAYAGKRLHKPEYRGGHQPEFSEADITDAPWTPLVSYPDWKAVSARLRDPKRSVTGNRGRQPAHLLSMIAECGKCGSKMVVRYTHHGTLARYTCRQSGCTTIVRDVLDLYVADAVIALLSDPAAYAMMSPADDGTDLDAARVVLAEVMQEHGEFSDLVGDGKLSPLLAARAEPEILDRLKQAEARVKELETPRGMEGLGLGPGADIAARWSAAPLTARRAVVRVLFEHVRVLPAGRGRSNVTVDERADLKRRTA